MSTRSMTAFASAQASTEAGTLSCEMRSVNHRFLELSLRLPDELRALEPQLRERVSAKVGRGKVDLSLRLRPREDAAAISFNQPLLEQLTDAANTLQTRLPALRLDFATLLQFPGVLQAANADAQQLNADALALLDATLDEFLAARAREGEKLVEAILQRVDGIEAIATQVRDLVPAIRAHQRTRLLGRLAELDVAVEPSRLEQELVISLQKLDVDEELDRLNAHISEIRRILAGKQPSPVGRRLDFLLQEFNREANTLGSKSVDARTSNAAVELKVLIDQIREQVQNIE